MVGKRELWEQPSQACAVDADCAVKPDRQNHQNLVISKWLLPELSFSDRWSRATKTLGTRLRALLISGPPLRMRKKIFYSKSGMHVQNCKKNLLIGISPTCKFPFSFFNLSKICSTKFFCNFPCFLFFG